MMTRSMTLRRVYLKRYNRAALSDHSQEDYRYTLNLWEKHSGDPTISKITDRVMADFRAKLLESGLSFSTVDRTRRILEAIFRCIAPPELGNPNGSGELRRIPRMEPCPRTNTPRVIKRAVADDPGPLPADPKQYTFRQATAALYVPESPEISCRTVQKLRHQANRWERFTLNPGIEAIGRTDFIAFRQACLDRGLSAATIEGTISDVLTVISHCADAGLLDRIPGCGKRIKRRPILRETPSLESFAKVYSATESVTWPVTLRRSRTSGRIRHAVQWWQGLLCASYLTGLRSSDLLTITWAEVKADRIVRRMRKTGFEIQIPAHPVLMKHLAALQLATDPQPDDPIFGHLKAHAQLRHELGALCLSQGVERIGLQSLRRMAAQSWERARPGAGSLILGHRFRGADVFYLDPFAVLQEAMPHVAIPAVMGEAPQPTKPAPSALDALRGLGKDELVKLLGDLLTERASA
ncbi:MAG TPA: hypothetical protein VGP76_03405 [Planctomycetaceae bacterium]|nr:hypothetical protein [Planctomycetaceae bacterium]